MVYQDIVLGASLGTVVQQLRRHPLHVVVLCPTPEAVAAREAGRSKKGYRGIAVAELDRALREETPRLGLWVDSSAQSAAETVAHILSHLDEARVS